MNEKTSIASLLTLIMLIFVHSVYPQTLKLDDAKIEYRTYGSGDTTLVFIHGWAIDQSYWQAHVNHFNQHFRVVTIDLAGHGLSTSDRKNWTIQAFGNDVIAVINALDVKNLVLIGHSMGGDVMLEAATQFPEKTIALVGVDNFKDVGTQPSEEERQQTQEAFKMMETNFSKVVDGYTRSVLFTPASDSLLVDSVARDMTTANQSMAVSAIKNLFKYIEREVELLQQAPARLYLIQSDAMPTDEPALTQYAAQGFEIFSVGKVSHYPMIEVPKQFNAALEKILSDL